MDSGGFAAATHLLQMPETSETAARLISVLVHSEYALPKVLKDHLAYHLIMAVGMKRLEDESIIEAILLEVCKTPRVLLVFFDALVILNSGSRSRNLLLRILSRAASNLTDLDLTST